MPDSVYYASSLKDAYGLAKFCKESWQDAGDIVKGNIRKDHAYYIFRTGKAHPDFLIEIHNMQYENLLMDDDGRLSDDNGETWFYAE
jgi:hypothetical protein